MQAIRSGGGNHPRNPSTPVVAYQVNPVDPRGIDKGHDVLDELVEPVGPPGPRPGMPGVTTLVRCDDPVTGREQWP
jgi:hypothetical protein